MKILVIASSVFLSTMVLAQAAKPAQKLTGDVVAPAPPELAFSQLDLAALQPAQHQFFLAQQQLNEAFKEFERVCGLVNTQHNWKNVDCDIRTLTPHQAAAPPPDPAPTKGNK